MKHQIRFGLHGLDGPFVRILEEILELNQPFPRLTGPTEIERFLRPDANDCDGVLAIDSRILIDNPHLSPMVEAAVDSGTFHVIVTGTQEQTNKLVTLSSNPNVHFVLSDKENFGNAFLHHCHEVKFALDLLALSSNLSAISQHYEDAYSHASTNPARLQAFLDRSREILGADSISVLMLHGGVSEFVALACAGPAPVGSVPRSSMESIVQFRDVCSTVPISEKLLRSAVGSSEWSQPSASILISTFRSHGVPGFILYTFAQPPKNRLRYQECSFVSREIFHLLRSTELRSQYETLKSLTEIEHSPLGVKESIWQILLRLKAYFTCDGVSIVELTGIEGNKFRFVKTFIHHTRKEEDSFLAEKGFACECILNKKALLINEIRLDNPPRGICVEFDPDRLDLQHASETTIETVIAPKTIENEQSVMYYPLRRGADVIAAIKVADLRKSHAFGLGQLRALGVFAEPISSSLANGRYINKLHMELDRRHLDDRMIEQAEALFFYREIALGVFHQLGNHLNLLSASISLLDSLIAPATDAAQDTQKVIEQSAKHAKLAKDLIKGAQQRGQKLKPVGKPCLLVQDIMRPVVDYVKNRTEGSDVTVRHTFTSQDYAVTLDPELAKESFINLMDNARWAIKQNKGNSKKEIFIAVRSDQLGRTVKIDVEDSGIGMDRSTAEEVGKFPPFHTTREGGTGLGLYFAKKLFEYFGGQLAIARTEPFKGTTFSVTLPLQEV